MMKNEITVGVWVEVLDDDFSGKVIRIAGDYVTIETPDGFELDYKINEVILKQNSDSILKASTFSETSAIRKQEEQADRKKKPAFKSKKEEFVLKVDLHIEKLVRNPKQYSNFEILNIQVENARSQLEFAISNKIKQLVFIHGMGDGVLKAEIESLLGRYTGIYYQEADYATYGLGATEVYLNQPMPI